MDQTAMEHLRGETGADILIVEGPPRHGKTEYFGKWLPSWFLGRYPEKNVAVISYGASIASANGRKARGIMRAYGPEWWDVGVSHEARGAALWQTDRGGELRTAGIGGPITGFGFHLMIVDDFLKNAEKALSPTIRQNQWDWWQSTVLNRLEPGGKIIIMATRWHEADLIGRTFKQAEEKGDPVAHLRLPAIAEHDDPLGREPGEALWPERWPIDKLRKVERRLERFWWLAQYQQRPSAHSNTEWPDAYFEDIYATETEWPDTFELVALGVDPSKGLTAKPGDYFATVWIGQARGKFWVEARLDRDKGISNIVGGCVDWCFGDCHPPDGLALESNGFQELLEPEFERQCQERNLPPLPIHLIHNTQSKAKIRIPRIGPYLRRRQLRFRDTPGTRLLVQQLRDHPMSDHDDGPDALESGLRLIRHLGAEMENSHEAETDIDFAEI